MVMRCSNTRLQCEASKKTTTKVIDQIYQRFEIVPYALRTYCVCMCPIGRMFQLIYVGRWEVCQMTVQVAALGSSLILQQPCPLNFATKDGG